MAYKNNIVAIRSEKSLSYNGSVFSSTGGYTYTGGPSSATGMTITSWIRTGGAAFTSENPFMIEFGDGNDLYVDFNLETEVSLYSSVNYTPSETFFSGVVPSSGVWYFLAITVQGTTATAYLSTDQATITDSVSETVVSGWDVDVFYIADGPLLSLVDGTLHHIRVFDSVLTVEQIEAELANGSALIPAYAAWELNNGNTSDSSGNGRNLTSAGSTASASSYSAPTNGGENINIGSLLIPYQTNVNIWDTVNFTSSALDNLAEVASNLYDFNLNIADGYLVMSSNAVDLNEQNSFNQLQEISTIYYQLNMAERGFTVLRLDAEETKGLVIDHGDDQGLSDDDHPQYLRVDGYRAITGPLDMGGNDIANAGDGYFNGKLTVVGLVDPTGLVLDVQSTVPGGTPDPGKATIWVRESDGYVIATDENGLDTVLSGGGGGGGSGDVAGPSSSTDNALARYNGATGKLIQNSSAILDDNGNLALVGDVSAADGYFNGKLTVTGLIDPTGLVLDTQGTVPGGFPDTGKATVWVNNDGYLVITDDVGNDTVIGAGAEETAVSPYFFDAYDAAGGTSIATSPSWTDVPLGTERKKDSIYTHSTVTANAEVTITESGSYIVHARVGTNVSSGTARETTEMRVALDTGGGFAEVGGTRGIMYNRQASTGGTHASVSLVLGLSAGDKIKIQVSEIVSAGSTCVLQANNSGLVIIKIPSAISSLPSHASRHVVGGADQITGNNIYLSYTPTNYPAPATNTIGAHIQKLDTALSSTIAVDTINLDGYDIVNIGTATFSSWPTITSDGYDAIPFDGYQKATLNLNNQSSVAITLNEPNGPGNFMLILKQGSSTATTTITWVAENGYDIYGPSGAITVAADTSSITMVGLAFDGSDWYVVSTQPMEVVV